MAWHHSGFSVHAGNRIASNGRDGQKALAEYLVRNAFSEQKACAGLRCGITHIEESGTVLCRCAMTNGSNKKNSQVFRAEEFTTAIIQQIPEKHPRIGVRDKLQMVRYEACP